jgi:hypothetical protein
VTRPYRRPPVAPLGFAPVQFSGAQPDTSGLERDEIRLGGELYMERFYLSADRNVRLHHICMSDLDQDMHDHPWDFVSVLLTGAYLETTESGDVSYSAPAVIARRAETLHRLTLLEGPMWTYVVTGPVRRRWGFATPTGWVHWSEYEGRRLAEVV